MSQRGQGWLLLPWCLNTLLNNRSPLVQSLRLHLTVTPIQLAWAIRVGGLSHHIPHLASSCAQSTLLISSFKFFPHSSWSTTCQWRLHHTSSNSLHSLTKHREEMVYHTLLLVSLAFHSLTLNLHSVPSAGTPIFFSRITVCTPQGCLQHSVGHPRMRRGWGLPSSDERYVCTRHTCTVIWLLFPYK